MKYAGLKNVEVVKAFEINDVANSVYAHNFGPKIVSQNNIDAIPTAQLNKYRADLWTMSPPCQPYTKQKSAKQEGAQDARSKSFFRLLDAIEQMEHRPTYLLVENVKGFEESESRDIMVALLKRLGYHTCEFLLNPLQFGIPNSRLRYYMLARANSPFRHREKTAMAAESATEEQDEPPSKKSKPSSKEDDDDAAETPAEVASALFGSNLNGILDYLPGVSNVAEEDVSPIRAYLEKGLVPPENWKPATLWKRTPLFDIIRPSSKRSCCFTKNYFHFAEGTGSVLQENEELTIESVWPLYLETQTVALQKLKEGESTEALANPLEPLRLRYFTPREVSNLLCFPEYPEFSFPKGLSRKQQYRLLGNSINVRVVGLLMTYLFDISS